MRWHEILDEVSFTTTNDDFKIYATKQFIKNYNEYIRSQPKIKPTFISFLDFKTSNCRQPFNSRDSVFATGTPLGGYRHFHIIYGKIIVVYSCDNNHMELYAIGEHIMYDTTVRANAIKKYIESLVENDFELFEYKEASSSKNFDDKISEIVELIHSLIPDEVDLLQEFLDDKRGLFTEMLYDIIGIENEDDLTSFVEAWNKKFKTNMKEYIKQNIKFLDKK
jgi:mRNA-degrading endonuclease YafQ of YafQ-DinJ toxin-antitoxin module